MPIESTPPESHGTADRGVRKFKRRTLGLADGTRLVLNPGGSIDHLAGDGTTLQTWAGDDADWARQALRFGIHPEVATVAPSARGRSDLRPGHH